MDSDTRARVCELARRWLGTPWHHRARVLGAGVDCGQLLVAVYESAGLLSPGQVDPGDYSQDWHLHQEEERFLRHVLQVATPTDAPRPGDIALFRYGRCMSHAAIVLERPGLVIHAYHPDGEVVISNLSVSPALRERLAGYYTLIDNRPTP